MVPVEQPPEQQSAQCAASSTACTGGTHITHSLLVTSQACPEQSMSFPHVVQSFSVQSTVPTQPSGAEPAQSVPQACMGFSRMQHVVPLPEQMVLQHWVQSESTESPSGTQRETHFCVLSSHVQGFIEQSII